MDMLSRLFPSPGRFSTTPAQLSSLVITTCLASAAATYVLTRLVLQSEDAHKKIIPSPRETLLPRLSEKEKRALPYPPDILPGARDVRSPYGTFRLYEWGAEVGRKVVLVHGVSTPCLSLAGVARGLVERGCRVLVFDLWGRGYSDAVGDLEYDERLFATQILLAVTSSPLAWTGGEDGGFSIVGYSLGGGIAVSFASWFPEMVKSVVLLAPSGLIRPEHMSFRSRFLYSVGLVPEGLLRRLVRRRLEAGTRPSQGKKVDEGDAFTAEMQGNTSNPLYNNSNGKLHNDISVEAAVAWQLQENQGFIHAFMSSIRYAPITDQQKTWRQLGLRKDQILIMVGNTDSIIIDSELKVDAERCLGEDKVEWRVIEGAHDFPVTKADEVVGEICWFWNL